MEDHSQEKRLHSIHDRFVKEFMQNPADAADMLSCGLPAPVAAAVKWDSLRQEPCEFINEHLGLKNSDLLFSVEFEQSRLWMHVVFEHQSSHEPDAALRTSDYKNLCYRQQLKKGERLGPVICLIFYHGREPWKSPDSIAQWVGLPAAQAAELQISPSHKEYLLFDLSTVNVAELKARAWVKVRLGLLQSLRNGSELEWLRHYGAFLEEWLRSPDQASRVATLIRYCLQATAKKKSDFQQQLKMLPYAKVMETFKTAADYLMEEGEERGLAKGLQQGFERGRKQGLISQVQLLERLLHLHRPDDLEQLSIRELEARVATLESKLKE
jgi:predicted transposase/invertase (TIGR01784 family)